MFLSRADALRLTGPAVALRCPDLSTPSLASAGQRALRGLCGAPFRLAVLCCCIFTNNVSGCLQLSWNSKQARRLWILSVLAQMVVRASPDRRLPGDRCTRSPGLHAAAVLLTLCD